MPAQSGPHRTGQEPADNDPSARRARLHAWRRRLRRRREAIRSKPTLNMTYRIGLGVFGGLVLVAGILMIPYPGPGWLVVFAGLGILATEFAWAHRVNSVVKHHYHRWVSWLGRQHLAVKLGIMAGTGLIVLLTLWLLGVFALAGGWFGLHWGWLRSPLS
jgi:uncharacterized protein (TIGR02611 family)